VPELLAPLPAQDPSSVHTTFALSQPCIQRFLRKLQSHCASAFAQRNREPIGPFTGMR
jgi:hypothetical protein